MHNLLLTAHSKLVQINRWFQNGQSISQRDELIKDLLSWELLMAKKCSHYANQEVAPTFKGILIMPVRLTSKTTPTS